MTPVEEPFFPTIFADLTFKPSSVIMPILLAIGLYSMRNETGIKIWLYRLFGFAYIFTYVIAVYFHFTL
jgi:hypothetical protein